MVDDALNGCWGVAGGFGTASVLKRYQKEAKKIEDEKERVKFIEYIKNPPPRCIK